MLSRTHEKYFYGIGGMIISLLAVLTAVGVYFWSVPLSISYAGIESHLIPYFKGLVSAMTFITVICVLIGFGQKCLEPKFIRQ
ncbi:MAG: hypothetical protein Q8P20_02555 [bacterium]|nr:hypothetical protein [bacterium]